jgi:hypothetical protein
MRHDRFFLIQPCKLELMQHCESRETGNPTSISGKLPYPQLFIVPSSRQAALRGSLTEPSKVLSLGCLCQDRSDTSAVSFMLPRDRPRAIIPFYFQINPILPLDRVIHRLLT